MFEQNLTHDQRQEIVTALTALLASRHQGIGVYATEHEIPHALAERIITTATSSRTLTPLPTVRASEVAGVVGHLEYGTRRGRIKATRTLTAIIRTEIAAGRITPVFTGACLTGIGGDVPKHVVVTAEQARRLSGN